MLPILSDFRPNLSWPLPPGLVILPATKSTLCYARVAEGGAGEEERRRDEGTGNRAKEVARAAGGRAKAAGARVIGG